MGGPKASSKMPRNSGGFGEAHLELRGLCVPILVLAEGNQFRFYGRVLPARHDGERNSRVRGIITLAMDVLDRELELLLRRDDVVLPDCAVWDPADLR